MINAYLIYLSPQSAMYGAIVSIILVIIILFLLKTAFKKRIWKKPKGPIPLDWRSFLAKHVVFYQKLSAAYKLQFEYEVQEFLLNYTITGIKTSVDQNIRLLIAASGVIPIFAFPEWKYHNLIEILVYPDSFNHHYNIGTKDGNILGMVGEGAMGNKMILSKKAIINGFLSNEDGRNTAVHEFVHLIDGMDGSIDGIPSLLMEQPFVMPWLSFIEKEMIKINTQASNLRPYGGTSTIEFFAVASEYFFEKPEALKSAQPELFAVLDEIFTKKV